MYSLWRLWHAATKDGVILGGELNRETNEGSTDRHWTDDRLLLLLLSGCLTKSLCPPSLSLVVSAIIRLGYQYNLNSNISPYLPAQQPKGDLFFREAPRQHILESCGRQTTMATTTQQQQLLLFCSQGNKRQIYNTKSSHSAH